MSEWLTPHLLLHGVRHLNDQYFNFHDLPVKLYRREANCRWIEFAIMQPSGFINFAVPREGNEWKEGQAYEFKVGCITQLEEIRSEEWRWCGDGQEGNGYMTPYGVCKEERQYFIENHHDISEIRFPYINLPEWCTERTERIYSIPPRLEGHDQSLAIDFAAEEGDAVGVQWYDGNLLRLLSGRFYEEVHGMLLQMAEPPAQSSVSSAIVESIMRISQELGVGNAFDISIDALTGISIDALADHENPPGLNDNYSPANDALTPEIEGLGVTPVGDQGRVDAAINNIDYESEHREWEEGCPHNDTREIKGEENGKPIVADYCNDCTDIIRRVETESATNQTKGNKHD